MFRAVFATAIAATVCVPAMAGYTITQGSSAPTYAGRSLNFDEPGGPTGVVSPDAWTALGITDMQAGDGVPQVGDFDSILAGGAGWLGDGNSFYGNFGVFMTLDHDVTEMSLQIWDPSGPPSFFGGGLNVILFKDGEQVWDLFVQLGDIATPAWGGVGDEWFDITTTDGSVFDEVRILGYGFTPTTLVDNLSWDPAAAPCTADVDGSGDVGFSDLLQLLGTWGPCAGCPEDLNGNDNVDFADILLLLGAWGACP